jgi:hypothetical protein
LRMARTRARVLAIRGFGALFQLAALCVAVGLPTAKVGLIGQSLEYGR